MYERERSWSNNKQCKQDNAFGKNPKDSLSQGTDFYFHLARKKQNKTKQNEKKGWENVHSSVWDAAVSMATYLATAATFLLSECPPASRVFGSQSIRARADCETRPGATPKIGARRGGKKMLTVLNKDANIPGRNMPPLPPPHFPRSPE